MRTLIALVLLGFLTAPSSVSAQSATYDIPAHVSRVDGTALIERDGGDPRATEGDAGEVLESNLTLTEGDRIRTVNGRVEILFADGTLLHLDRHTTIDFQREDFVRVMAGRVRWWVSKDARAVVRVDTPSATLELDPGGDYRIAVAPGGDAELAVLRGSGALLNDHGETELRAGERAVAERGRAPSQAYYANAASWDDFDRWSDNLRRARSSAVSVRYLPNELQPYGSVFDSYGSWRTHPSHGYVWYPVAAHTWQPYSHGRWHSYPRYGWTWIGRDPWAWPTHHFGRWGFSAGAWFWIPGRSWAPAWVAWASSPGFVGWSPLGWNDHPIYGINVYRPNYSAGYPWCGWTFIRDRHFGGRHAPGQIFVGTSIDIVARSGIVPAATSPITGRHAVPRNGVTSGTAVPRGTATSRTGGRSSGPGGSDGSTSRVGQPGGLAGVPTARPRRIPTDTIRSTGPERSRAPRSGSTDAVRDGSSSSGSRTATPREGTATESTARPRGGSAVPRAGSTEPAASSAGRPIRRRSSGDSEPRTYVQPEPERPSYPYSTAVPRGRDRSDASPAQSAPESRVRQREPRTSGAASSQTPPRREGAERGIGAPRATEPGSGAEPRKIDRPERGGGAPRVTEPGFGAEPRQRSEPRVEPREDRRSAAPRIESGPRAQPREQPRSVSPPRGDQSPPRAASPSRTQSAPPSGSSGGGSARRTPPPRGGGN